MGVIDFFFLYFCIMHCIIALIVNLNKDAKIEKTMMYAYFAMTKSDTLNEKSKSIKNGLLYPPPPETNTPYLRSIFILLEKMILEKNIFKHC